MGIRCLIFFPGDVRGNSQAAQSSHSTHLSGLARRRVTRVQAHSLRFVKVGFCLLPPRDFSLHLGELFFPPQGCISHRDIKSPFVMLFLGGKESAWEEKFVERWVKSIQQTVYRLYSFQLEELVFILPPPPLLPLPFLFS